MRLFHVNFPLLFNDLSLNCRENQLNSALENFLKAVELTNNNDIQGAIIYLNLSTINYKLSKYKISKPDLTISEQSIQWALEYAHMANDLIILNEENKVGVDVQSKGLVFEDITLIGIFSLSFLKAFSTYSIAMCRKAKLQYSEAIYKFQEAYNMISKIEDQWELKTTIMAHLVDLKSKMRVIVRLD